MTRADAVSMREKVDDIELRGRTAAPARGPAAATAHSTTVTEREVNAYLAYDATADIPVGLTQPRIRILGDRLLSGSAIVDLDAVRAKHRSSGWLDPLNFLSGRLPVVVSGRLSSGSGIAWFQLESATLSGVTIPKTLLQELVSYYSRTATNPNGLNIDDPFPLPAGIRRIDVLPGKAVVVQ